MLAAVTAVVAQTAMAASQQADMCTLTRIKNTRSAVAGAIIRNACWKVYDNGSLMSQSQRQYYDCLLQNLPGTESDVNARQIANICGRQGMGLGQ
jgi:hypothetical protein